MSTTDLDRVREQARALSEDARAELAHDLLETLDGAEDPDAAGAWEREILNRLAEIEAGTAVTLSRKQLAERLQRRFQKSLMPVVRVHSAAADEADAAVGWYEASPHYS